MKSDIRILIISLLLIFTLLMFVSASANVFIIACLFFCISGILLPIRRLGRDRISLEALAVLSLSAYSLAVPLHHVVYQDYETSLLTAALSMSVVGIWAFCCGNFLHFTRNKDTQRKAKVVTVSSDVWKISHRVGMIVFITGIMSSFLAIYLTVGIDAYFTAGYAGRALLKRNAGPVELGLYHTVFGFLMILLARLSGNLRIPTKNTLIFSLAFISIFVGYVSFLGIRRPSFFLLFSVIILLNVTVAKFNKKSVLAIGIPAVLTLAIFASFRQVLSDHGFYQAITYVGENFSLKWLDLSTSELGAPFRVLTDVMQVWKGDGYRYGSSIVQAIPNLLPSAFGIDFVSLSEEYTQRNFSLEFIAIGGNMGFSPIAEGYVNGSYVGVFVLLCALGYLTSMIQFNGLMKKTPNALLIYVLAAPWFVFLVRTDVSSYAKVLFYSIVLPYVFSFGLSLFWARSSRR